VQTFQLLAGKTVEFQQDVLDSDSNV